MTTGKYNKAVPHFIRNHPQGFLIKDLRYPNRLRRFVRMYISLSREALPSFSGRGMPSMCSTILSIVIRSACRPHPRSHQSSSRRIHTPGKTHPDIHTARYPRSPSQPRSQPALHYYSLSRHDSLPELHPLPSHGSLSNIKNGRATPAACSSYVPSLD